MITTFKELNEKSKSKSQQRLFGMALAYKKGKLKTDKMDDGLVKKIKDIADGKKGKEGMSIKDLEDFAKTKHEGLPNKVKKEEKKPKKCEEEGEEFPIENECNILSFESFEIKSNKIDLDN